MAELRRHTVPDDTDLADALAALAARVAVLERRLGVTPDLQEALPPAVAAANDAATAATAPVPRIATPDPLLPSLGAAALMLAGAFLLRAITDAGTVPANVGLALATLYAAALFVVTDRAASRGPRLRAQVLGAAALMVAFPFVWESATRLGLMPAGVAAGVTVALTALGLAVVVRHRLRTLSWAVLIAALALLGRLYWTAGAPELFLAVIIALGAATVWFAYLGDWTGPRWLTAPVANLLTLVTVTLAAHPATRAPGRPEPTADTTLLLALALPAVYIGSFAWRTLLARREAGPFEILQSFGCLAIGYLGAIHLLRAGGHVLAPLGVITLALALGGYAAAFALVRRRQGRGLNFFYFAWLGLTLTMIGTALVVPGQVLAYLWCGLGLLTAAAGGAFDRWTLRLHGAAYLIGASVLAGMPGAVLAAFFAPAGAAGQELPAGAAVVWLAAIFGFALLAVAQPRGESPGWRLLPRFLVAVLVLLGLGVLVVLAAADALGGRAFASAAAGLAVVRSAFLAAATILAALLAARTPWRELGWLVNPLLVLIGLKLVLEDLPRGTPAALFVSFGCFGCALLVAPRLRRRRTDQT